MPAALRGFELHVSLSQGCFSRSRGQQTCPGSSVDHFATCDCYYLIISLISLGWCLGVRSQKPLQGPISTTTAFGVAEIPTTTAFWCWRKRGTSNGQLEMACGLSPPIACFTQAPGQPFGANQAGHVSRSCRQTIQTVDRGQD